MGTRNASGQEEKGKEERRGGTKLAVAVSARRPRCSSLGAALNLFFCRIRGCPNFLLFFGAITIFLEISVGLNKSFLTVGS